MQLALTAVLVAEVLGVHCQVVVDVPSDVTLSPEKSVPSVTETTDSPAVVDINIVALK